MKTATPAGDTKHHISDDDFGNQEKIGIRRIQIKHSNQKSMAVVGSFFAADNLLQVWSRSSTIDFECRFEITYLDGCILAGTHKVQLSRNSSLRSFFARHARFGFGSTCPVSKSRERTGKKTNSLLLISNENQQFGSNFLDRYEIEDFAPVHLTNDTLR
ncbi:hypothetical protein [Undibacterium terreum]|uniref:hypothetical protein n=1 Tax=Undibacterium terreum TaxID=1224302 RepID=UPI00166731F2|nr:hypothetical protein [Undibacterium terreum]